MALKKSELYSSLWSSCDALRGGMDASQYKDYVLVLLFIKYISDKYAGQPYAPITDTPQATSIVSYGAHIPIPHHAFETGHSGCLDDSFCHLQSDGSDALRKEAILLQSARLRWAEWRWSGSCRRMEMPSRQHSLVRKLQVMD